MLMLNYSIISSISGRQIGGGGAIPPTGLFRNEVMMNRYFRGDETLTGADSLKAIKTQSFPTGTEPPYSYTIPMVGGELSSQTYIGGEGSASGAFSLGKTMTADLSGDGSISSDMSITASMIASIAGTGDISASMAATLSLASSIAGSGDLAGSLSMLIPLVAELSGVGAVTSNLRGNLDMNAEIFVNQSTATVEQIATGVWSALATENNVSGTMGEKLNAAGTAGDPWTADLSGYTTAGTAGKILQDAKKKAALAAGLSA